jgi:hypothetical protein
LVTLQLFLLVWVWVFASFSAFLSFFLDFVIVSSHFHNFSVSVDTDPLSNREYEMSRPTSIITHISPDSPRLCRRARRRRQISLKVSLLPTIQLLPHSILRCHLVTRAQAILRCLGPFVRMDRLSLTDVAWSIQ